MKDKELFNKGAIEPNRHWKQCRMSFIVTLEEWSRIQSRAKHLEVPMTHVIRLAIREYLNKP